MHLMKSFTGSGLTAIFATSEEVANWVNSRNSTLIEGSHQAQLLCEEEELRCLQAEEAPTPVTSSQKHLLKSSALASSDHTSFPFICECFFLTARVLNLGLLKTLSDFKALVQVSSILQYRIVVSASLDVYFSLSSTCL